MRRKRDAAPVEAFLSHASSNQRFASRLASVLNRHGVAIFFSRKDIRGAQQWHDELGRALMRCDWFLLLLSPQAVASEWVKRELAFALQEERYRGRIVPLLYRKCDPDALSWVLKTIEFVEFRNFDRGCENLLKLWGIRYRAAKTQPRRR